MARKYEIITEIYQRTIAEITSPQEWRRFLTTACRNFRLPFDEQILLYAQRPDATAVLPIDGPDGWNRRFGRWVNRGATGIAVFDRDYIGRSRLKYYFDISDTHESRFSRPVPLWEMQTAYEAAVVETLENSFGELSEKENLAAALLSAAQNAVEDNLTDYLAELMYYKEGSFLEVLDGESIEAMLKPLTQSSISYMLLTRCGLDPAEHLPEDAFGYISGFNTPNTLNALGTATGDIAKMCLNEISRTVRSLQRQNDRTFEISDESEYPDDRNETERSNDHDTTDLHETRGLPPTQPAPAPGAGGSPWEVRIASQDIPEAAPKSDLHESADIGQAEPAPVGDPTDSPEPDGADHRTNGERRGRDGGTESQRSHEVDGADEQHPTHSRGNSAGGTDLRIDNELPPFLEERFITAILENRDDDLKSPKAEIQNFFREHDEQNKRAEYLKTVYPDRFTELIVDGTRIGYRATDDGLLMWEGAYLSRTKESVFSWGVVAELTGNIIEQNTYFFNTKIKTPPGYDEQQISFMDGGYLAPESEEQLAFFSQPELPQQVIDKALCIGANDENSRLIICAYFMKDHTAEKNAAFLQKHYGTNGAGFYINDREYALWYDPDGIRVSTGRTVQTRYATQLSWDQAARRIRELLDLRRYMPQSELDRVAEYEYKTLSESLALTARDFSEEAITAGYSPTIRLTFSAEGGFPEIERQISELLKDPDMLAKITDEWAVFVAAYEQDRDLMRFPSNRPKELLGKLQDLQRKPITFRAAEGYAPDRRFFISNDEIDRILRGGEQNTEYRLGIYSFFSQNSDPKDREKYLKNYHGEYSGYHGGNDNRTYTGKGLFFSHGSITEPYAKVELGWGKITKRISELISTGNFLSEADRAAMPEYERKRLAKSIHSFFYDTPEGHPKPFSQNMFGNYWEGVREIQKQLDVPERVEEIYQTMMLPLWESTPQDDRHYESRKAGIADMRAFIAGTYSVFNRAQTLQPSFDGTEVHDNSTPNPDWEKAEAIINEYCLEEFGQEADYSDPYHVDLAYSSTADSLHNVEIFADLMRYRLVYQVDNEIVHEITCDSMEKLNEYLADLDQCQ